MSGSINIEIPRESLAQVLVIDDDPFYKESLKRYLESLGTQVSAVSSIEDAKRLIEQETFQVVIADIFFGDSKDTGDDFIVENANSMKGASVFAITGYSIDHIKRLGELTELGVHIIEKGDDVGILKDVIDKIIDGRKKALQQSVLQAIEKEFSVRRPPVVEALERNLNTRRLRVFLCHSSNDKPAVRALYKRLRDDGVDPWLDEESLLPGVEWEMEIPRAVRHSDIVIVCLSKESINKRGYVQKEIRFALDVADQQPEDTIYIIPVKLEDCDVPERLRRWQWVNLFEEKGYERLKLALEKRAAKRS